MGFFVIFLCFITAFPNNVS